MKESLFTDIVLDQNWSNLSFEDKVKLLQKLEHEISEFQKRSEREIYSPLPYFQSGSPSITYSPSNSDCIKITGLNNVNAPAVVNSFYSTTFAVMCDDYIKNKANIKSYVEIDSKKLDDELSKLNLLFMLAKGMGCEAVMEIGSYNGILANNEGALYMLDKISSACESESDCAKFLNIYFNVLNNIYQRIKTVEKYAKIGITFENIKNHINDIDAKIRSNLIKEINTSKMILSNIKPEISMLLSELNKTFSCGANANNREAEEYYSGQLIDKFVNFTLNRKK